ncbi:MAG TPA: NepR family anti-sigma factor [Xanthobacteraceae bacterium]|jgi:hypothetical protein
MQTDAPARKPGGRLSREDQRRLGDILQRVYDDVVKQGVPDRFRKLLHELEGVSDSPQTITGSPRSGQTADQGHDAPDDDGIPDRIGAKRSADPGSSGSH